MPTAVADQASGRLGASHLEAVLRAIPSGLLSFDRYGRILFRNERADALLGLASAGRDARRGTVLGVLATATALDDRARARLMSLCRTARAGATAEPIALRDCRDGTGLLIALEALADGRWLAEIRRTDAKETARTTTAPGNLAPSDQAAFDTLLATALAAGDGAVALIGLDRFRFINERWGRATGDTLLRLAHARLRSAMRPTDDLRRLDGDRMAVLLTPPPTEADLAALGERIVERMARPFLVGGHPVSLRASVGTAVAQLGSTPAGNPGELLRRADLALCAAKNAGGGRAVLYRPALDERLDEVRALESDLRGAQALGQFELHFQPQVAVRTEELIGFEALLRWRHPTRGLVSPAVFIPAAEELGLIAGIGDWVLRAACRAATSWPDDLPVAVNVSARQFEDADNLVAGVTAALALTGLPGHRLEIEITESALLNNPADVIDALRQLRAMGIRIAMDDFGTGYSSLSQLHSFPFDRIKIDRTFVAGEGREATQDALIRAIAALGCGLGMSTVAEGVETPRQLERVRAGGCDSVQGYLFSRPVPTHELPVLIETFGRRARLHATPFPA